MPLSEHEQRLLDQIERALYAEDPKFAHAVRATSPQVHYKRRVVKAALGFFIGVCLLMAGVVAKNPFVGAAGFVVMLVCCVWGLTSWKRMNGLGAEGAKGAATADPSAPPAPSAPPTGRRATPQPPRRKPRQQRKRGFMERFEERWRRRHEGDGF